MKKVVVRYRKYLLGLLSVLLIGYYFCLPSVLFQDPYSTVLEDFQSELLAASIASDGQWRFPELDTVPEKFATALVAYEDKRFWNHPGVDVLSFGRAMKQNLEAGEVISGGSTIDMQVIRLSRKGKGRTVFEKMIESVLATRLEWRYSKEEILALYASHAPFGGNVVGLEAACWRYFGREPKELSWAEAAMLAVLPNSPSLIHPGKNRDKLLTKRNRLLARLKETNVIDQFTYELAIVEPIPAEPLPLPRYARHLLTHAVLDGKEGKKIKSTVQAGLQQSIEQVVENHHQRLKGNQIFNASAIILDVETGNVLAYVGNTNTDIEHQTDVDVIISPRSTGSILKPFLYAAMLEEGRILPKTLLPDVPTMINGFSPQNFNREYDGAVAADKAIIRSLNVPAVYMLRDYRYERFHQLLKNIGMRSLNQPPDHYGLSLILGGAEGTLWDITGMYASMARTLNHYGHYTHWKNKYDRSDFHQPNYVNSTAPSSGKGIEENSWFSAASIYETFDALKEVYRPGEETGWKYFSSSKRIAWKTGTSFGFRDGWAVGVTPRYAVGVWVGNADGEGRPGLTGTETAAPVMFEIFSQLRAAGWFQQPYTDMQKIMVCSKSGQRFTDKCEAGNVVWVGKPGLESSACSFHKKIHLTKDKKFQINSACESMDKIAHTNWFVLPPIQEYYFKAKNLSYKVLPPFRPGCQSGTMVSGMDLIYPKPNSKIFIPRDLDGTPGSSVFELAHRNSTAKVYWHLDGEFIGETQKNHQIALNPGEGRHTLTIVDEAGEALERQFEVISKL
ncbi:MAG TPA: penicillin-binding protein 1C [Cyclobacteriaceae bacterium]|nr:penicillin-binding protein 1C [Cyclobacteriaceae bacterium]